MPTDRKRKRKAKHVESQNLVEIALEIRDPAKWAAMQICKTEVPPGATIGEAMDLIEGTIRRAIEISIARVEIREVK